MMRQFNNKPLRILLASLASGLELTDSFFTSTLRKHLFRETKLSDMAVKNPGILRWNGLNRRYAATATTSSAARKKSEDGEEEKANDETPTPTMGGGERQQQRRRMWRGHLGFRRKKILSSLRYMDRFSLLRRVIKVPFLPLTCLRLLPQQPHDLPLSHCRLNRAGL
ncbi:hypothetical protein BJ165DRAFT_337710 [Panaeolus papilionaceus]|nr:hypothetical protein BJ165DRAFT_337710 [Panaeolus papilionaceus]